LDMLEVRPPWPRRSDFEACMGKCNITSLPFLCAKRANEIECGRAGRIEQVKGNFELITRWPAARLLPMSSIIIAITAGSDE